MSVQEVSQAAPAKSAPLHTSKDVQSYIESMWIRASVPLREHEVIRVVKLDMPYYHIWRVDCLEKAQGLASFTYVIIVYEHLEDLYIALSTQEQREE